MSSNSARERRIKERLGYVPAYATVEQGGPVDVAPAAPRGGRRGGITAPQDPAQGVSKSEFDDMVANLGIEESRRREPAAAARADARPAGGRRARARGEAPAQPQQKPPAGSGDGGDGEEPKPKKPRNRKHGRPR